MIKQISLTLFAVVLATSMMAQSGLTCDDAIPVNNDYVGSITEPGEYWFTAFTYDLPMVVHFSPESDASTVSPQVFVDFTCTPGVYDHNHKLDSVINGYTNFGLELPVEFACDKVNRNGKTEWDLSINATYREHLTKCGVTENVQAFVKVYFSEPGSISLNPDNTFKDCMASSEPVALGDTFDIAANDSARVFVLPYSEWKKDSVQFKWIGEGSARVWIADGTCEFTPVQTSVLVRATYDIADGAPYKLQSADITSAVENWEGGGVFFAKVLAPSAGKLVVEKIPMPPVQGNAILMEYNKPIQLEANDDRVFALPKIWVGTQFQTETNYLMDMYVATQPTFEMSSSDDNVIDVFPFWLEGTSRQLQLSTADMEALIASASEYYLYVRFKCNQATTITPTRWTPSSEINESLLIRSGKAMRIPKTSSPTSLYRMRYSNWKEADFTMKWNATRPCTLAIAPVQEFSFRNGAENVLYYGQVTRNTLVTISADDVNTWGTVIDDLGYLYVKFKHGATTGSYMTFTSTKPAEEDPIEPTSPCVASSIELKKGDQLTLNLDSAFTVYRIKYDEWVAADASLTWTGAEPLHTFIAETCTFAVAPYNKYVHTYVPVPANGNIVLDTATLTDMAEFVDEDGYLYIRFLTEFEGTLSVQ